MNQFTLKSPFVATAFVALACAAAFWPREPIAVLLAWLTVPVSLCCAVGTLHGLTPGLGCLSILR